VVECGWIDAMVGVVVVGVVGVVVDDSILLIWRTTFEDLYWLLQR